MGAICIGRRASVLPMCSDHLATDASQVCQPGPCSLQTATLFHFFETPVALETGAAAAPLPVALFEVRQAVWCWGRPDSKQFPLSGPSPPPKRTHTVVFVWLGAVLVRVLGVGGWIFSQHHHGCVLLCDACARMHPPPALAWAPWQPWEPVIPSGTRGPQTLARLPASAFVLFVCAWISMSAHLCGLFTKHLVSSDRFM